jgi:hypothetical protein
MASHLMTFYLMKARPMRMPLMIAHLVQVHRQHCYHLMRRQQMRALAGG